MKIKWGDILKMPTGYDFVDKIVEVKYEEEYVGFNLYQITSEFCINPSEMEVIGNIYQNKELLK